MKRCLSIILLFGVVLMLCACSGYTDSDLEAEYVRGYEEGFAVAYEARDTSTGDDPEEYISEIEELEEEISKLEEEIEELEEELTNYHGIAFVDWDILDFHHDAGCLPGGGSAIDMGMVMYDIPPCPDCYDDFSYDWYMNLYINKGQLVD